MTDNTEHLMIEVITTDLSRPGDRTKRVIDHENFDDRKWLARHCWWAMRNNRQVTTRPA